MSADIPTDEQLRAWAQEQLQDSRFMYLNADLLRVLIHHVRDAAVAEYRATLREQAKEKAWIDLKLTEGTCTCGNVGYFGFDNTSGALEDCNVCKHAMCLNCSWYGYCKDCDVRIQCCKACSRACVNTECSAGMCVMCADVNPLCTYCLDKLDHS